jgi:2,4-dienoyl-CoA reductase (NADPH2)
LLPWEKRGNTVRDSAQVCRWLEEAGVDAIHVSTGSSFPHPRNPAGKFPVDVLAGTYDTLASSGMYAFRNLVAFRVHPFNDLFRWWWEKNAGRQVEGQNLNDARAIKRAVNVPVLCTGGFQTASVIRRAIEGGYCDGVSIARPLVANNDLVQQFAAGRDRPLKPCTYCNKCLGNVIENPIGCYEESRFESREAMIAQVMSVYDSPPFPPPPPTKEAVAHDSRDVP